MPANKNIKLGDKVTYVANKNADPVLLTYIEKLKNGQGRFFVSKRPSLEYHLDLDSVSIKPYDERLEEDFEESYVAFRGCDENKRKAYEMHQCK